MKAIAIYPSGRYDVIDGGYESIHAALGGYLEIAPTPGAPFVMYVNEHGKLNGLPFNLAANELANRYRSWRDPLVGPAVLVGLPDNNGNDTEFTLGDFARVLETPEG